MTRQPYPLHPGLTHGMTPTALTVAIAPSSQHRQRPTTGTQWNGLQLLSGGTSTAATCPPPYCSRSGRAAMVGAGVIVSGGVPL
jgi:hypothetical protein